MVDLRCPLPVRTQWLVITADPLLPLSRQTNLASCIPPLLQGLFIASILETPPPPPPLFDERQWRGFSPESPTIAAFIAASDFFPSAAARLTFPPAGSSPPNRFSKLPFGPLPNPFTPPSVLSTSPYFLDLSLLFSCINSSLFFCCSAPRTSPKIQSFFFAFAVCFISYLSRPDRTHFAPPRFPSGEEPFFRWLFSTAVPARFYFSACRYQPSTLTEQKPAFSLPWPVGPCFTRTQPRRGFLIVLEPHEFSPVRCPYSAASYD